MGLMWVFIGIFVLGVIISWIGYRGETDFLLQIGLTIATILFVVILISLFVLGVNNINAEKKIISYQERREKILYNIEVGLYTDKLDIKDVDIINSIEEYNLDIRTGKAYQHNPWIGVFYPDIYDEFELIPYEGLKQTGP